ncbi:PQQ-binding-like beta-propeller repeat protein [Spirosoma panaciterrae]|uniref:outer membrane protein assembly factor BamB family protein n=1 Tax=Spirosoma panaciterrae TaxID=496058 RepID=UPI0003800284|nr:PQQ-binding-like beta-propeller repeat protein [Spirosoma panaciterrae]
MLRPILLLAVLIACFAFFPRWKDGTDWPEYLGGPDRNHYSTLTQIDTNNVTKLQVSWSYSAPDTGQMQMNPIIVNGVLYGISSALQVFALDAATGRELWRFGNPFKSGSSTSRGVSYWTDGQTDNRILFTSGVWLYALNAQTGQPIPSFGENGRISLRSGLGESAKDKFVISNTPGTIFENLIVMPVRLSEGADAAPGYVQAFDVRTGKLAWVFHTIPHPGEFGYETWPKDTWKNTEVGGANNWAGMAIDQQRGILYVPTGSAAFDFYGGNRKGQNLFANCLLALDARSGKRLWHYQFVHHDIWDRDFPSPPNLVTITKTGSDGKPRKIDAVTLSTKSGHILVFDRVTGKSLYPIREVAVAKSQLPGEASWPTQPQPQLPVAFSRQSLTEADLNPYSTDRDSLKTIFRRIKKGYFAPPDKQGTLIFPGYDGGAEWGGSAVDPDGILYVNANEMAWVLTMIDAPKQDELAHLSPGERIYTLTCSACHGRERKGNVQSGYPSLVDIGQRRDRAFVEQIVSNGKGMMPGFTTLKAGEKQALIAFLFGEEKHEVTGVAKAGTTKRPQLPFKTTGYNKFLDSKGYPAIAPPWGTLTAINLNTGKRVWQNTFGEYPELKAAGIPATGTENYGGPVITAGGVLFIAATRDGMFRAYNKRTGKLLWETKLPAAGFATPSTYQVGGKQYVVIACGGTKLGTKKGNQVVAFALP